MANDDFTPSRDFIKIFNEAKRIKNIDDMAATFAELAAEVGLQDDAADLSSAAAGKRLAERLNTNSSEGVRGKKI